MTIVSIEANKIDAKKIALFAKWSKEFNFLTQPVSTTT
jgi:hypothetical protein